MLRFATASVLAMVCVAPAVAAAADKDDDQYIKVDIKGTLETGIVAIGGETTGVVIHVKNLTWELDLGDNAEWKKLAEQLNKKTALVTGTYSEMKGVEIPVRRIVKVSSLKAPDAK
jgi:hypothetical protein